MTNVPQKATVELDPLLRRSLEQTLIPSPNVVELAPAKGSGFVNRLAPSSDDVAELFHLNTRLSRHAPDVRLSEAEKAGVREWYFTTCGRHREEDLSAAAADLVRRPHAGLPSGLAATLAPFGAEGQLVPLLYRSDLVIVVDDVVCRQQPGENAVWVEHTLSSVDMARLRSVGADPWVTEALTEAVAVVTVVGVPWRSMLENGPRGYRRMLMDSGVLLNAVCGTAQHHGLRPRVVHDFYDDELDDLLHCDGLERSVLAMVPLLPPAEDTGVESGRSSR